MVVSTLDQARMFLADQPIEGPEEPRKNLQPKTGERLANSRDVLIESKCMSFLDDTGV